MNRCLDAAYIAQCPCLGSSDGSLKKAGFAQPFSEDADAEEADHYLDDHTKLKVNGRIVERE